MEINGGVFIYMYLALLRIIRGNRENDEKSRRKIKYLKVRHRLQQLKFTQKMKKLRAKQLCQRARRQRVFLFFILLECSINLRKRVDRRIWVLPRQSL